MAKKILPEDVKYTIRCIPRELSIGDVAGFSDKAPPEWIQQELDFGNQWAWCDVEVTAKWNGFFVTFTKGPYNLDDWQQFIDDHFDEAKKATFNNLEIEIKSIIERLELN